MLKFSILFDNYVFNDDLTPLWGFSCFIEIGNKKILFDTGSNGRILLKNAKQMKIDFKTLDMVFISHNHWDHIGGLDTIIEENPNITLVVPNTLSKHLIKDLRSLVDDVIVIDDFKILTPNLYTTGLLGNDIKEQALIIDYQNELYIITGCGHMGIDNLLKEITIDKKIKYIIGGFHMLNKEPNEIKEIMQNIYSDYITATHCTGDIAIGMFKIKYKERFLAGGVGSIIKF